MNIKSFLYQKLASWIPETRMYRFKAYLLSICGHEIHSLARIVSSAKFIGSFKLKVGQDSYIGHEVLIAGGGCSIVIGDHCDLGPRVCLVAGSHEIDMTGAHTAGKGYSKDILVEDGAWLGANVTVIGGVRIGSKSVIGAGSVVVHDIPPKVIAFGNPCEVSRALETNTQPPNSRRD